MVWDNFVSTFCSAIRGTLLHDQVFDLKKQRVYSSIKYLSGNTNIFTTQPTVVGTLPPLTYCTTLASNLHSGDIFDIDPYHRGLGSGSLPCCVDFFTRP